MHSHTSRPIDQLTNGNASLLACTTATAAVGSRLYKLFGGRNWKRNTATTALLFPGAVFTIFWALNITMWFEASTLLISQLMQ
jgi:Endomembrane protein 70